VNFLNTLTPRERQIVAVLCEGLCNKRIGRRLNISEGTVKQHLVNVFRKLKIAKRTTLMAMILALALPTAALAQSSLPGLIISGNQRCSYNSSGIQYCSQICTNPICLKPIKQAEKALRQRQQAATGAGKMVGPAGNGPFGGARR
jgi:DNA-binding CsgD family transcriptional regulator